MQIEVWSDIVCPWCYIGKRRLETALARFPHKDRVEVVWRSFQLIHLAAERGLGGAMKERLLHAHFEERRSVFDVDALVPLGVEVGLDEDEVRTALTDKRFLPAVRQDIATARALGGNGVPFFVVDRAYGASGAQPPRCCSSCWNGRGPTATRSRPSRPPTGATTEVAPSDAVD